MIRTKGEKIRRGIEDKIENATVDMEEWAEFWGFTVDEYDEFLDMAIEALEQDSDLIRKSVNRTPFIVSSAEPKRGERIAIDDAHSQCMECGAIFCITSSNEGEVNYCPNCGERMESDE